MVCHNCNNAILNEEKICPNCGAAQTIVQPQYIKPVLQLKVNRSLCKMFF